MEATARVVAFFLNLMSDEIVEVRRASPLRLDGDTQMDSEVSSQTEQTIRAPSSDDLEGDACEGFVHDPRDPRDS
jgi:hypothetical protein